MAAAALVIPAAHAACETLDGTYRYESVAPAEGRPRYLSDLTFGPERRKIIHSEAPIKRSEGFTSDRPRNRPKVTHLAATGTLAAVARGATIEFRDATGKALATMGIGEGWVCKGETLERSSERTHGLGDDIRTDRVQERLAKSRGDLLYTESATSIDPPSAKPTHIEVRFAGVK